MPARRDQTPDDNSPEANGNGGPQEAVAFVAETLTQLIAICERHHLGTLSYLLGMAQLEAREIEQRGPRSHR